PDPARVVGSSVTFEPGARTAWHSHPLGQTLIVTAGCGRVQRWSGPIEEIHPGDVIWFEPGEKHWHGAAPTTAMTHLAIQERLNGKTGVRGRRSPGARVPVRTIRTIGHRWTEPPQGFACSRLHYGRGGVADKPLYSNF